MTTLQTITLPNLRKYVRLRERIQKLEAEAERIVGSTNHNHKPEKPEKGRRMSHAARQRIARSARLRWRNWRKERKALSV
jgi:hypothetical protein